MKFVDPWIFWLSLPLTLAALTALIITEVRKRRQLKQLFGGNTDWKNVSQLSPVKRWIKYILLIAALPLLGAAAARPYIRTKENSFTTEYREITVLFDVSKSMRATDLPPSRMEQAKYLLREITAAFPSDRFALIAFAGNARMTCPMTADHYTFDLAVNELSPESVPFGGTDLGAALESAEKSFPETSAGNRVVILLTDGDELSGDTAAALEKLREEKIPLIAIGFGSPEIAAPVPGDDGTFMRTADGKTASSKLNEKLLQEIAASTGGCYIRSTIGDTGFNEVKKFLDQKIKQHSDEEIFQEEPDDLFPYFAGAGAVLLFLSLAISCRKGNFFSRTAMIMTILFCCGADEKNSDHYTVFRNAHRMQTAGDKQSVEIYNGLIDDPEVPTLLRARAMHNLAVITQKQGREEITAADTALTKEDLAGAESALKQALAAFSGSKEQYMNSFKLAADKDFDRSRVKNFNALLHDVKKAEKLLKKIDELKKAQETARQQTKEAQQQNQQNQQNGNSKQNQQNGSSGQSESDNSAEKSRQAADAAEKLAENAEDLNQKKMAENARSAMRDLREAEKLAKEGKNAMAQKKLDEAAEKLQNMAEIHQTQEKKDETDGKGSEKVSVASPAEKNKDENKESARKVIELLNEESDTLRNAIYRNQNRYYRQVKEDW